MKRILVFALALVLVPLFLLLSAAPSTRSAHAAPRTTYSLYLPLVLQTQYGNWSLPSAWTIETAYDGSEVLRVATSDYDAPVARSEASAIFGGETASVDVWMQLLDGTDSRLCVRFLWLPSETHSAETCLTTVGTSNTPHHQGLAPAGTTSYAVEAIGYSGTDGRITAFLDVVSQEVLAHPH